MRLLVISLTTFLASEAMRSRNDTDGNPAAPPSLFLVLSQPLLNGQYPSTMSGKLDEASWSKTDEKQADDTQRAIVIRVKRQVREHDCRGTWCARSLAPSYSRGATVPHPYDSVPRRGNTAQAPVASFTRLPFTVTSAPFMAGGDNGHAFPPSSAYPPLARISLDGRANGYIRPSIGSSVPGPRAFNAFSAYPPSPPPPRVSYRDTRPTGGYPHSSFNHPLPRLSRGGPMRGTGSFAQALGMKSPIPWIRNWQTESRRPRLGVDARRSR